MTYDPRLQHSKSQPARKPKPSLPTVEYLECLACLECFKCLKCFDCLTRLECSDRLACEIYVAYYTARFGCLLECSITCSIICFPLLLFRSFRRLLRSFYLILPLLLLLLRLTFRLSKPFDPTFERPGLIPMISLSNPADAMTKSKPCQALKDLIDTNTVKLQLTGWVERMEDVKTGTESVGERNLISRERGPYQELTKAKNKMPPVSDQGFVIRWTRVTDLAKEA